MSDMDRRQLLKGLLGLLTQAAGAVVVASATVRATAQPDLVEGDEAATPGVQERADQLANAGAVSAEDAEALASAFLNGGFRNTPWGAFRNAPLGAFRNGLGGAFRNGPIGAFQNAPLGAFRNGPAGAFRNGPLGAFGNGGWPNGGWGGFGNGWPNLGWRNW